MKWISVNEKLPPEPVNQVDTLDKIMEAIEAEELVEYLVVIDGAKKATTLYYTGDGEFFDAVTQDLYPVIAGKSCQVFLIELKTNLKKLGRKNILMIKNIKRGSCSTRSA